MLLYCRSGHLAYLLGGGFEFAMDGSVSQPGEAGTIASSHEEAKSSDHRLARHWISWLIPLLAIVLPVLGFLVAASIPNDSLTWKEVDISTGRGDFIIPAVILCLEAIRRWWFDMKCGVLLEIVRLLGTILCGGAVVVGLYSVAVAASDVVTSHTLRSITVITWSTFTAAFLWGTIAVVASMPRKPEESMRRGGA
jgi:hypothetical protein